MTHRTPVASAALLVVGSALASGCSGGSPASGPPQGATSHPSSSTTSSAPAPRRARLRIDRLASLPQPVGREAVSVGAGPTKLLVAGGLLPGDTSSRSSYTFDVRTGRVSGRAALPTAVHDTAGAFLQGAHLVIGGGNAAEQSVVQVRRPGGWSVLGNLPSARSDLSAVTVGHRLYVLGGYDGHRPAEPAVLVSSTGQRWRTLCRLPVPVRYAATAVLDGSIYVLGGERDGAVVDVVQRVDPATHRATVVGHLRHALGHAAALAFGTRILLAGGRTSSDRVTSRMWWLRPRTGTVTPAGRLPRPLADTAAVSVGSTGYLVGGETPGFTRTVLRLRWPG